MNIINIISKKLPTRESVFKSRWLKPFAPKFNKPYFWSINRRRAAKSVAIGMFCGLMPGPTQMLSALIVTYYLRANIPVALFTTLYTNPLTYIPLYFVAYRIGAVILGIPTELLSFPSTDDHFWSNLWHWLAGAGKPLLVGVPILGLMLASLFYFIVLLSWRCFIIKKWKNRHCK